MVQISMNTTDYVSVVEPVYANQAELPVLN